MGAFFSQIHQNNFDKGLLMKALFATVIIGFSLITLKSIQKYRDSKKELVKAREKRKQRDIKLKESLKYLDELKIDQKRKDEIANATGTEILKMLNKGETTSLEVLLVFFERSATLGVKLELVCEFNIDWAVKRAKECDRIRQDYLKNSPEKISQLGLLFGLPISIKENQMIEGLPVTLGCTNFLENVQHADGLIVKALKAEGAIPFVQSNIPQLLLIPESINNTWGRAKNPWNIERTPGGSSGGESGLIAARCSPLGIGSDIGSSIRNPCNFTGIMGLKSHSYRMSLKGGYYPTKHCKRGQINVRSVAGPMARSCDDLNLLMKVLVSEQVFEGDPFVPPLPWRENLYLNQKKLRLGYYENEDLFPVAPGVKRAVRETIQALRSQGHECVEVKFPGFEAANIVYFQIMTAEGRLRSFFKFAGKEPLMDEYKLIVFSATMPSFLRKILSILFKFTGSKRLSKVLSSTDALNAHEFFDCSEKQQAFQEDFVIMMKQNNLDGLITPSFGLYALKHGESKDILHPIVYSTLFNFLDLPSGVVPVTLVRKEEEVYEDPNHNDKIKRKSQESVKGSAGLPIGVQVITLPYQEEACLNIMKEVEKSVNFSAKPPNINLN